MEEDLFVVIVGDPPFSHLPLSAFKFEPDKDRLITDVPVEHILKLASRYSGIIDYGDIKQESPDAEYLYIDEAAQTDECLESQYDHNMVKRIKQEPTKKKKKKKKAPPRQRSLADDLRATNVKSVCPVCKKGFPNVTKMQIHTSTVHTDILLPHKCTHCPAAYPHIAALKRHVKVQHSGIKYICDICKHVFNKKDNLITHIDTHLAIKRFSCDYCQKRFAKKFNLNVHVNKVHKRIPPPFVCETCPNKRYYLMSELKAHMSKEHGLTLMTNTNFINKLPTMGKQLLENAKIVTKEELEELRAKTEHQYYEEQQQLEREPIKKFACSECSKRYTKIFDLNIHVKRDHKKLPPPFACEMCDKRYFAMSPLKEHMRKEHGVSLINKTKFLDKLPTLNKPVTNATILTKEEFQQISGKKEQQLEKDLEFISIMRFPCTHCDKSFELKTDLKNHMEMEHYGLHLPVTCQVCHKEYKRLISLKRHMKRQHNMIVMTPQKFQNVLPRLTKAQIEEAQVILKTSCPPSEETVDEIVL